MGIWLRFLFVPTLVVYIKEVCMAMSIFCTAGPFQYFPKPRSRSPFRSQFSAFFMSRQPDSDGNKPRYFLSSLMLFSQKSFRLLHSFCRLQVKTVSTKHHRSSATLHTSNNTSFKIGTEFLVTSLPCTAPTLDNGLNMGRKPWNRIFL